METDQVFEKYCSNALYKRIHKQHLLASAIAVVAVLVWGSLDYFVRFEDSNILWVDLGILVISLITYLILKADKGKKRSEIVGFIWILLMTSVCAIFYNTLTLEEFSKFNMNYVAIFVWVGMFFVWKIHYSLILLASNILLNVIMFSLFSPLNIHDYMNAGGILVLTMGVFMVISIHLRYRLINNDIRSSILLKNSEERANQFINTAKDGLITIDDKMLITLFNPAAEEMFGYKREEILGSSLTKLMPEDKIKEYSERKFLRDRIHNLKYENETDNAIYGKRSDGTIFPMDLSVSKMELNGKTYTSSIIKDITLQNKAKQDLIKAKRLAEESKEMQSRFLSNMSHEIRTPMNGIIGITRLLQDSTLDETQAGYLNAVQKSAENLLVIINDILDFSKIEAGKMTLENIPFNLSERLEVVKEIMRIKAEEKGIYIRLNLNKDVPTDLVGDPIRLNQVLLNLVNNAIKFTDKGGVEIFVDALSSTDKKVKVLFRVKDTGIGIENEKIETIFSSFTQASLSTTRKYGGTGLGLTISKQLVDLQAGKIWVASEAGVGSEFCFELEYDILDDAATNDGLKNADITLESAVEDLKGLNVLLVEDHDINQLLATTVLENWGIEVDLAENGVEAVDKSGSKDYDVILMDISMPEMDGYEATRNIRKRELETSAHVPIIAMTASALIGENQKCFKAGMDDYISKPFSPEILLEKIANQMTHKLINK